MSLYDQIRRRHLEVPGSVYVTDKLGALRLAREAARRHLGHFPAPDAAFPGSVIYLEGVPLLIRRRMPTSAVYVLRPEVVPSPTRDDLELTIEVASSVKSVYDAEHVQPPAPRAAIG